MNPLSSLFPDCTFKVLAPEIVVPGQRYEGVLVLEVPEPIERAEHVDLAYRCAAWAGYGSGKSRTVVRRDLFVAPMHVDLPVGVPLPAGTHRYPFAIDVPPWLPPTLAGNDCAIVNVIEARLDVDWAKDPVANFQPRVVLPPRDGTRAPVTIRTPPGFHDAVVLEVNLASQVISQDEPLVGELALRGGHDVRFTAAEIVVTSAATIRMGRGDERDGAKLAIEILPDRLRSGDPVPFRFPPLASLPPTFRNGHIDHDLFLTISLVVPWGFDPAFRVPLTVLPHRSTIHGSGGAIGAVGGERLRRLAAAMAEATGLRAGRAPTLVEGEVGPVRVAVADGPRGGALGVDVDVSFPDLALGIDARPRSALLDLLTDSALVPEPLRRRLALRLSPEGGRPPLEPSVMADFLGAVLGGAEAASEVRVSDQHLGLHFPLRNDGGALMVDVARFAQAKATAVAGAIERLPFPAPLAGAREAWTAAAAELQATLVPSVPALAGVTLRARVVGGEERALRATVRTAFVDGAARCEVDVDFAGFALPPAALGELVSGEADSEARRAVRATFPHAELAGRMRATLHHDAFADDPRALLPGLDAVLAWALAASGDRRADAPYR